MYRVDNNKLVIYKLAVDFDVINQCYEECCNKYNSIHQLKKGVIGYQIENILSNGICFNLVKKEITGKKEIDSRYTTYNIEYDKLEKPYPTEVMILDQIKRGNITYMNHLLNYINNHLKDKPYLQKIYDKILGSTDIQILETLEFHDFTELLEILKVNDFINRELIYASEVLEKYYVSDDIIQKIKNKSN